MKKLSVLVLIVGLLMIGGSVVGQIFYPLENSRTPVSNQATQVEQSLDEGDENEYTIDNGRGSMMNGEGRNGGHGRMNNNQADEQVDCPVIE